MNKRDVALFTGMLAIGALLLANLLKPEPLQAREGGAAPELPVHISAAGDSAWAIVGNRVYYVSMRPKTDFPANMRSINVIDSKNLE